MNDVTDLHREITEETPWLGAALVLAGALVAAGASLMVVLILGIAPEFPDTLPAHVLIGFLTVLFVGLGGFGVRVALRGASVVAPEVWKMILDQREALVIRSLAEAGYGVAGCEGAPREHPPTLNVRIRASRRPRHGQPIRRRRHAMKKLAIFLAVLMGLHPLQAYAQGQTPLLLKLQEGTRIVIRPPYDIRSDKVKTGDVIDFVVVKGVEINGVTVIERGAKASVTVTEAKHASGFGQSGKLKLAVNSVVAVDGTRVPLRGAPDKKGGDNTALSVAGILLFSVFFVFMQGKEAVLKADKELDAYVDVSRDFMIAAPATNGAQPAP